MNSKYASDLPYPQITDVKNPKDSKLLMGVYSGAASELTQILTYSYQAYISQRDDVLAKTLLDIAKVEMLHHSLLGRTIYALGGYPVMGARTYWNGNFVNYAINPQKFLLDNIASEKNGILNYERTILNLETDDVKYLLERIILDEEVHLKVFEELLKDMTNE